ncbi:metallophosphoesterase (plasmid) [Mycobacterium avium subsp. hominissuis]|uniref:metallophosphoesterase family protein n=1 Tax=Mycobacterium avium TaxID=1764 RepID=UPI00314014BC
MRALVIADVTPQLGMPLPDFVRTHRLDAVITAGDLSPYKLTGIDRIDVPTMGVYGNHCRRGYLRRLGMHNLHLSTMSVGPITFTGLEGCVRYKRDPDAALYTQQEYQELVAALPPADVLVTHCPPRGINDHDDPAHVGIEALNDWLHRIRPAVMIHGHTYPAQPVRQTGSTRVEYVHGGRIVTI